MIRIRSVSKSFRGERVLEGIALEIGAGERVALVGPNGAGKTTLIRCLLGEYRCEGVVTVDGCSPRAHRREVLRRVGFVPQLPPPLKLPVGQLVGFASSLCGCDPELIGRVAARVGLDLRSVWHRPFARLSGGQKQKLLISLALREATDLLVLDEPAANLDPTARGSFFELLKERDAGVTMLVSIHRLDEVSGLVNRVVELDCGRVVRDERLPEPTGEGVARDA
jgi:ABC-2 type transport system ATP-binding protein